LYLRKPGEIEIKCIEDYVHILLEKIKYIIDKLDKTKTHKVIFHTGTGLIY